MKQYRIKGNSQTKEYLTILKKRPGGFEVKITRIIEDYIEEKKEFLSKQLFDTCLRTAYLEEVKEPAVAQTA